MPVPSEAYDCPLGDHGKRMNQVIRLVAKVISLLPCRTDLLTHWVGLQCSIQCGVIGGKKRGFWGAFDDEELIVFRIGQL